MRSAPRVVIPLLVVLASALVTTAAAPSHGPSRGIRHASKLGRGSLAHHVRGGTLFHHPKGNIQGHDQEGVAKIPAGSFVKRVHTQQSETVPLQQGSPPPAAGHRARTLTFFRNTPRIVTGLGTPNDPNVAAAGQKVVVVNNEKISLSVDGGLTFHSFGVGSLYADAPDGGVCCDQVIRYAPSINRFIWIDQYWNAVGHPNNRDRLAVFSPAAVTAGGLTSWTYWDITAAMLPGTHAFLDYPDLAVGNNYVYLSQDAGDACCSVNQSFIARIGLDNLQGGLNLAAGAHAWRYLDQVLLGGQVTQNTLGRAFWARNTDTSHIQVNSWDESSTSYLSPAATITIGTWPNSDYVSKTPDGLPWIATYGGSVIGEARGGQKGNSLWFAWTAGRGTGQLSWLAQPHIELVEISASGLSLVSQRAIWNASYAFAYPALMTNSAGQLGISMAWGGGTDYENFAVGNLTTSPFLVYSATNSTKNCGCGRWGDYFGIGTAGEIDRPNEFVAAGYGFSPPPAGGPASYDAHFVGFQIDP
jgi:hypothetical protein